MKIYNDLYFVKIRYIYKVLKSSLLYLFGLSHSHSLLQECTVLTEGCHIFPGFFQCS